MFQPGTLPGRLSPTKIQRVERKTISMTTMIPPPQMGYEGVTGFPFPGYKLATETYRVSVRKTRVETRVASGSRQITSSLGPRAAA